MHHKEFAVRFWCVIRLQRCSFNRSAVIPAVGVTSWYVLPWLPLGRFERKVTQGSSRAPSLIGGWVTSNRSGQRSLWWKKLHLGNRLTSLFNMAFEKTLIDAPLSCQDTLLAKNNVGLVLHKLYIFLHYFRHFQAYTLCLILHSIGEHTFSDRQFHTHTQVIKKTVSAVWKQTCLKL